MSANKQLNEEQLEKISGGKKTPSQSMAEYQVAYTTDGSDSLIGYSSIDANGNVTYVYRNGGVHYLGWYKLLEQAITAGQNWCTQNNVHYVHVQQVN